MTIVRTRFAPSPTGDPHIGSIWTALFNWLYARHHNGQFILRIEDTDRARLVPGAEDKIIEALHWYGLQYDEGPDIGGPYAPYRQSDRLEIYHKHAERLIETNAAYYCFCSPDKLEKIRTEQALQHRPIKYDGYCRLLDPQVAKQRRNNGETSVIRLKVPSTGETSVDDVIRGHVVFKNELIDDQILMKSDGWPTYHLASVIDDYLMKINVVIRAEEWLPSVPKQLLIYKAFDWDPPQFAHLPLILGADRSKLSKRHGSANALKFRQEGYLPEAVINYLVLLGWNPKTNEEFFSVPELISRFDLKAINKAGALFNQQKLDWFNSHYLRSLPPSELLRLAKPYLNNIKSPDFSDQKLERILAVAVERANNLSAIPQITSLFFEHPTYDSSLLHWKKTLCSGRIKKNLSWENYFTQSFTWA